MIGDLRLKIEKTLLIERFPRSEIIDQKSG
jgi:hypothetical protein